MAARMLRNSSTSDETVSRRPSLVMCVVLALLPLRAVLASSVGVAPDEAYYFSWSEHLAWGYADHPPLVAFLIALSTFVAGDSQLALRLPAVIFGGVGLPLALFMLGKELGLNRSGTAILVLSSVVQPLGIAAGLLITPDVPLILCWTACAALVIRSIRSRALWSWCLAGVAAGGALLSKHSAWILVASIGVGLLVESRARHQLKTVGPWLALGVALLLCSPNLIWDGLRGFPSLSFQLHHGLSPIALSDAPLRLGELIGGQVALLTPFVAWAVVWSVRRGAPPVNGGRLLLTMALAPLALFTVSSLLTHPEANWPAPAHPLLIACALAWLNSGRDNGANAEAKQRHGRYVGVAVATSAVLTAGGVAHLLSPLPFFPPEQEPAARLRGWNDLPDWLTSATSRPLHADDYELAAALSYHLPSRPPIVVRCGREEPCRLDAIALVSAPGNEEPTRPPWFSHPGRPVIELATASMHRNDGEVVRTIRAYQFGREHGRVSR